MTIGERIKNRRIELGLSVDDVANQLGKNRATVYRYENGYIEDLPTSVLASVAKVLQTTPADLMGCPAPVKLTPEEESLIEKYRHLDASQQARIDERMNEMLAGKKENGLESDVSAS